ncbi:MAG: M3 family oligoendopeptidase [Bacteriovorax sp.]|jgi:oligoendopeptidase F
MSQDLQNSSWDNSNVYTTLSDPKLASDMGVVLKNLQTIDDKKNATDLETVKSIYRLYLDTCMTLHSMLTFGNCMTSVNALDYAAKSFLDKTNKTYIDVSKSFKPIQLLVLRSSEEFYKAFLDDPRTAGLDFILGKERERNDFLLSDNEEVLLTGFSTDGLSAWGKLYSDISGAMKINVDGVVMGLSGASNILGLDDRKKRESAFRAINAGWRENEIAANAILNSINGWRNENCNARSTKKELHYLDSACHSAHITRATLDTLMETTYNKRSIGQEVLKISAAELGTERLGPWDLLAPAPTKNKTKTSTISYPEAMNIIEKAFNEVDPSMGAFARMMEEKKWIDCATTENRAPGAYCTKFAAQKEPRVFMTYDGSMKSVITLAHEIGHAYHTWVMRDLDWSHTFYPMTLAETASIFAETTVRDYFVKHSSDQAELKSILWQDIQSAQSFLINIPARFEFEKRFVEKRKINFVSVPETKELISESLKHWYGETLSEYDEMFWASKLHFHMSGRSFYNYPYLFGYLFSMGVYAKKAEFGADFHPRYVALLMDTGRMKAEELVMKHFNEDITKEDFWLKSISIVEKTLAKYKSL